ncbi:hypothetical protein LCGC14_2568790, partial [marine sediment metagenome]
RELVDTLVKGPVKKMAEAGGKDIEAVSQVGTEKITKAVNAMRNPKEIGPKGIKHLSYNMNQQNPAAFPRLARHYFESAFDDAAARIQGAPQAPMAGVNWLKTVYGNKATAANTNAVLRGVAQAHGVNANEYLLGWRTLFKVIDRSGRTPGMGSPTQPRADIAASLRTTKISEGRDLFIKLKFDLLPWRTRQLASILTARDSVSQIRQLAYLKPRSKKARALVISLLAPVLAESKPAEE